MAIKANGQIFTHAVKMHPKARGAARFGWFFKLCTVTADGLVQFASGKPRSLKPEAGESLIEIVDAAHARTLPIGF